MSTKASALAFTISLLCFGAHGGGDEWQQLTRSSSAKPWQAPNGEGAHFITICPVTHHANAYLARIDLPSIPNGYGDAGVFESPSGIYLLRPTDSDLFTYYVFVDEIQTATPSAVLFGQQIDKAVIGCCQHEDCIYVITQKPGHLSTLIIYKIQSDGRVEECVIEDPSIVDASATGSLAPRILAAAQVECGVSVLWVLETSDSKPLRFMLVTYDYEANSSIFVSAGNVTIPRSEWTKMRRELPGFVNDIVTQNLDDGHLTLQEAIEYFDIQN